MKNILLNIAIGILVAALILLGLYYLPSYIILILVLTGPSLVMVYGLGGLVRDIYVSTSERIQSYFSLKEKEDVVSIADYDEVYDWSVGSNSFISSETNSEPKSFLVLITADYDSGDYVTTATKYTDKYFSDVIIHKLLELKDNYSDDYALQHYPDFYELNLPNIDSMAPHTLKNIEVLMFGTDNRVASLMIK